jgi:hypothetical protein
MSYSDYEEDSEVELEEDAEQKEEKVMKDMVIYCKYGWVRCSGAQPNPLFFSLLVLYLHKPTAT